MPKKKITAINEDFDFKLFVTIARRNFIWVMIFMASTVLFAFIYLRYTSPIYESVSILKLANQNKANSVLDMTKNYFSEENRNQMAGDIELIRSRILAKQALAKLPLDISYYEKGTVLDYEMYRTSPFMVDYLIKDSTIFGLKFFIEWNGPDAFSLIYEWHGHKVSNEYRINQWIDLPEIRLKVTVVDYKRIIDQQKSYKAGAY